MPTAKATNPAKIDAIAARASAWRNTGSSPNNIGTDTGPISAANHEMISPSTPPNRSASTPTTNVSNVNSSVDVRATRSERHWSMLRNRRVITGKISRVITDEMVKACRSDPTRDAPLVQALIAATDPETGRPLTDEEISNDLLIFMLAGHVPSKGEVFTSDDGVVFEVIEADPRRVKRMRIRLPRPQE